MLTDVSCNLLSVKMILMQCWNYMTKYLLFRIAPSTTRKAAMVFPAFLSNMICHHCWYVSVRNTNLTGNFLFACVASLVAYSPSQVSVLVHYFITFSHKHILRHTHLHACTHKCTHESIHTHACTHCVCLLRLKDLCNDSSFVFWGCKCQSKLQTICSF